MTKYGERQTNMAQSLEDYRRMGHRLEKLLRPASYPLAIRRIAGDESPPDDFRRPVRDLGIQNFICQNFKMARTYGWSMAITEEDIDCRIARVLYGWDPVTEDTQIWMDAFSVGLYAKDSPTNRKIEPHLYAQPIQGLAISPLTRTKIRPEVILAYVLPAQAMRLIQAYLYMQGGVLEFSAAGRMGSCHEGILKSLVTDKPQLVLLGNGDRVWGGAQDDEVAFACPHSCLEDLLAGLEATHKAGLRYPVPAYMNFSPGFQSSFEERAMDRAGGTLVKK